MTDATQAATQVERNSSVKRQSPHLVKKGRIGRGHTSIHNLLEIQRNANGCVAKVVEI